MHNSVYSSTMYSSKDMETTLNAHKKGEWVKTDILCMQWNISHKKE